jgi:site-specific recombinase XerD
MIMRRELAAFLDYCRIERRLALLTCSAYERDVVACLAFLEREGIVTLSEVRPADLRRFLADEATRRPSPSSQARTVAALKCFFRFLLENEQLERDPAQVLRTPRKREASPTCSTGASSRACSTRPSATTSGSASMTVSASATGSCSRSSPTPAFGAVSYSASTGQTSTSSAAS